MELEFWGDVGADPESLMGGQGWVWGWGTSPTKRSGSIGRGRGPFQKNRYFSWHGMRWCILSGIFGPRFRQKKCWIFTWSGILVDVEDVLLRSNEYFAGVMGLVNFLLHLIVMLVMQAIWGLKFLNVIKSGGQLALVSPTVVERLWPANFPYPKHQCSNYGGPGPLSSGSAPDPHHRLALRARHKAP